MRILNIPGYAKFVGSTRNYQLNASIVLSNELYNAIKDHKAAGGDAIIRRDEDLPVNSSIPLLVKSVLSEFCGTSINLLSKEMHYYLPVFDATPVSDELKNLATFTGMDCNYLYNISSGVNAGNITEFTSLNAFEFNDPNYTYQHGYNATQLITSTLIARSWIDISTNVVPLPKRSHFKITIPIYPEDIIDAEGNIDVSAYLPDQDYNGANVEIEAWYEGDWFSLGFPIQYDDPDLVLQIRVDMLQHQFTQLNHITEGFSIDQSASQFDDPDDPNAKDGYSKPGGGDGTMPPGGIDNIDPATIPGLPSISAADLGFITMYNPTVAQLKTLSDFMWSSAFDLATYKKLFADPMDSIIGLAIVPVAPSIAGSKNVHFGTIDSGVNMDYLSSNWVQLDCGSVSLQKYVGNFMDYTPYTKISVYLPFIGIRSLSADDVIGGSIHIVYNIDVLTGACACFIEHSSRGVLYTYNGSCITNVPITSVNFSGAIQNAVSAVISGIGTVAGIATGAAPVSAMGAMGLLNSAANTAMNSKPQVQRSGNLGGSAGILSILKPYVIIERPNVSQPSNMQDITGQPSNITYTLGTLSGFTMCEYVHVEDCPGTSEEVAEIESLLKQGVYL